MGYSTKYTGTFKFNKELSIKAFKLVDSLLGEDLRHRRLDWAKFPAYHEAIKRGCFFIDLEFTEGLDGLKWNDSEKTNDLEWAINLVMQILNEKFPGYTLNGRMVAQGEEVGDIYELLVDRYGVRIYTASVTTDKWDKAKQPKTQQEFQDEATAISERLKALGIAAGKAGFEVTFEMPGRDESFSTMTQIAVESDWAPSGFDVGDWYSSSDSC